MAKGRWERRPVFAPLDPVSIWEHTPLDYYRYGEYPRFIRPVRPSDCRWEWVFVPSEAKKEL